MKLRVIYNVANYRIGRWFLERFPAKYHYPFMFFAGPRERVPEPLFRHELEHHYQVLRDGWLTFNIRYIWQLWRKGYMKIDYEIEAYNAQHKRLTDSEREMLGIKGKQRVDYHGYGWSDS